MHLRALNIEKNKKHDILKIRNRRGTYMALSVNTANTIGWVGAIFSTICAIPQVFQAVMSQSAEDVSIIMYFLFIIAGIFWVTYGIGLSSFQVIFSSSMQIITGSFIIGFKLKNRWNQED